MTVLLGGHQPVEPGTLDVVAGSYRVVFKNDDLMFRKEIRVRVPADGSARASVAFPEIVSLTILAQPSNASVRLAKDGLEKDLGYVPIIDVKVVTGSYKVKCVFHHNGETQEKTIQIDPGDVPRIRFVAAR